MTRACSRENAQIPGALTVPSEPAPGCAGERALALRWTDVNLVEGTVNVRRALDSSQTGKGNVKGTKTGRNRMVDIDEKTVEVLRSHRAVQRLLINSWGHRVRKAQGVLGADAVPALRLRGLRHTHASLLLAAGVPVKVVSARLGHASVSVTVDVSRT